MVELPLGAAPSRARKRSSTTLQEDSGSGPDLSDGLWSKEIRPSELHTAENDYPKSEFEAREHIADMGSRKCVDSLGPLMEDMEAALDLSEHHSIPLSGDELLHVAVSPRSFTQSQHIFYRS